jgi:hypothetical protein
MLYSCNSQAFSFLISKLRDIFCGVARTGPLPGLWLSLFFHLSDQRIGVQKPGPLYADTHGA